MLKPNPQGSLFAASFRLENDVVNAINWLSRPDFQFDSDFDFKAHADVSDMFKINPEAFIGTRNSDEWFFREVALAQELQDRRIISQAGAAGIGAAMLAGVLSPTVLLPIGGAARAATVIAGSAKAAVWTVVGVGIQETVLQHNQQFRTAAETAISISTAAVIGGILGGAVRYLDPLGMNGIGRSIASDMVTGGRTSQAPITPSSVGGRHTLRGPDGRFITVEAMKRLEGNDRSIGAAVTPFEDLPVINMAHDVGKPAKAFGFEKLLRKLNPIMLVGSSEIQAARWFMNQLDSGGIYYEHNIKGVITAPGGDILSLVATWDATIIQAIRKQRELFNEAYYKAGKGGAFRARFALGDAKIFAHEMTNASRMKQEGLVHPIPEVVAGMEAYENVFKLLITRAIKQKMPGFVDVPVEGAMRRAFQHVRQDFTNENLTEFRKIIRENAVEVMKKASQGISRADVIKKLGIDTTDLAIMGPDGKPLIVLKDSTDYLTDFEIDDWADAIMRKVSDRLTNSMQRHGTATAMIEMPENAWQFYYINPTKTWSSSKMMFGEFLEPDIEKIARSYVRTMSASVELHARFGVVNPSKMESPNIPIWTRINDQFFKAEEAAAGNPKKLAKLAKHKVEIEQAIETQVGRLLHTWGQPVHPTSIMSRAARAFLQVNTMRLMGGVVPASIPDLARPIMKFGFMNNMRHGLIPLIQTFSNPRYRMSVREALLSGALRDVHMHGRTNAYADLLDEFQYGSMPERALQVGTSFMGRIALFDYWNQAVKGYSASVLLGTMIDAIDTLATTGKLSGRQSMMFSSINLSRDDMLKIHKAMRTGDGGSEIAPGVFLPNTESWVDQGLVQRFRASLVRAIDDTIVTPGLDRPGWVDGMTAGRLASQFRSFTLSSTMKVGLAGLQDLRAGNIAQIVTGVPISLALGLISYYTWASAFGPGSRPRKKMLKLFKAALDGDTEAWKRLADEAIDRSGLIGVFAEAIRFAERVPALAPHVRLGEVPTSRSPFVDPLLDIFGPSIGFLKNASTVLTSIHDPTSMTFNKGKTLLPYQNVFYLRWGLDQVRDAAKRQLGINN